MDSPSDCPLVTSSLLLLLLGLLTIGLLHIFIALAVVQVYLFFLHLSLQSVIFPPVPCVFQDSLPHCVVSHRTWTVLDTSDHRSSPCFQCLISIPLSLGIGTLIPVPSIPLLTLPITLALNWCNVHSPSHPLSSVASSSSWPFLHVKLLYKLVLRLLRVG